MRLNHHEVIYRGKSAMEKLSSADVTICGAGALGSHVAVNLARCGVKSICVIDRDRVEEHNVSTQIFGLDDVGGQKADILRNVVARDVGIDVRSVTRELTDQNLNKLLKGANLVVDTFDNSRARHLVFDYCTQNEINCLHAGVNDEYGEIVWNENYRVPQDVGVDACDYPLARNLILLVSAVASECLLRYLITGQKQSYAITLGDLSISAAEF